MAISREARRRMLARPLLWAGAAVLVAAILVQITRTGVDVLGLLVGLFILLLVERTLGDWIADSVGPVTAILIFTAIATIGVTYVSTDRGRSQLRRIFVAAEEQGYHTAYFSIDEDPANALPSSTRASAGNRLPEPTAGGAPVAGSSDRVATSPPSTSSPAHAAASAGPVSAVAGSPVAGSAAAGSPVGQARVPVRSEEPKQASGVRIGRLSLSPELAVTGQTIVIRVELSSDGNGELPEVEFTVDNRSIAHVKPDAHGTARAQWTTKIPGQYVVRVHLATGLIGAATASATLNVLPGRVSGTFQGKHSLSGVAFPASNGRSPRTATNEAPVSASTR